LNANPISIQAGHAAPAPSASSEERDPATTPRINKSGRLQ
jgi:hypothetical protein